MTDANWQNFLKNELQDGIPGAEPKAIRMHIKTSSRSGHHLVVVRGDDGHFVTMDHTSIKEPRREIKLAGFNSEHRGIIRDLWRTPK